jgi:type IV secretory pathway protease TraF
MRILRSKKTVILVVSLIAISLYFIKLPQHYFINMSESLPLGLYKKEIKKTWMIGKIVVFFPPENVKKFTSRDWLPPDIPIMKPIAGLTGDRRDGGGN